MHNCSQTKKNGGFMYTDWNRMYCVIVVICCKSTTEEFECIESAVRCIRHERTFYLIVCNSLNDYCFLNGRWTSTLCLGIRWKKLLFNMEGKERLNPRIRYWLKCRFFGAMFVAVLSELIAGVTVCIQALATVIAFCSWAKHLYLSVPSCINGCWQI